MTTESASAAPVRVAVIRESLPGERRVALVPRSIAALQKSGCEIRVESGAGIAAMVTDEAYTAAGATVTASAAEALDGAALVLKVRVPSKRPDGADEVELLPRGCTVVGMLAPGASGAELERLAARGVDALSLELLPRITRAQEMDALSSMSTVTGYHAVLRGAVRLPKLFPLLMTAAGTVTPARVLVLGAGVAGLQAIATARRLGAVVEAFDVRPAAREQVESLGARFVDAGVHAEGEGGYAAALDEDAEKREREVVAQHVAEADVVITTALVPGRQAPVLITREMVEGMRPGSVIVDLAAEQGGNCEVTEAGREVVHAGVLVDGPRDMASLVAADASRLYSHNVTKVAQHLVREGRVVLDMDDEITRAICVVRDGSVLFGRPAATPQEVA